MADLISREDAMLHLRIDGDESDQWLALWIPIIRDSIKNWLKEESRMYEKDADGNILLDSNDEPIYRQAVKGAAMVELAHQYAYREGRIENRPASLYGFSLCAGATALLEALRRPTVR